MVGIDSDWDVVFNFGTRRPFAFDLASSAANMQTWIDEARYFKYVVGDISAHDLEHGTEDLPTVVRDVRQSVLFPKGYVHDLLTCAFDWAHPLSHDFEDDNGNDDQDEDDGEVNAKDDAADDVVRTTLFAE